MKIAISNIILSSILLVNINASESIDTKEYLLKIDKIANVLIDKVNNNSNIINKQTLEINSLKKELNYYKNIITSKKNIKENEALDTVNNDFKNLNNVIYAVKTYYANIRKEPNGNSKIMGYYKIGHIIEPKNVKFINSKWVELKDGYYISSLVLTKLTNITQRRLKSSFANIRNTPYKRKDNIHSVISSKSPINIYQSSIFNKNWYKTVDNLYINKSVLLQEDN